MTTQNLCELLENNPYPGRGLVLGLSDDGQWATALYFIMGRSVNSRNRVFAPTADGIMTKAHDPALLMDPSLIIYSPVRMPDSQTLVVTNGNQTDTICAYLDAGKSFAEALRTRHFEPDAPNYTPRISGLMTLQDGQASYQLALVKSDQGEPPLVQRFFYEYPQPRAGVGHLLHTYQGDGDPLPSFAGEPRAVALSGDLDTLMDAVWTALHPENKISLYGCRIHLATGEKQTRMLNKLAGD